MSLFINGNVIGAYLNGAVKSMYIGAINVFNTIAKIVVNGVLQSGYTLVLDHSGNGSPYVSGVTNRVTAYSGANFGYSVSVNNVDIRSFSNVNFDISGGFQGIQGYTITRIICGTSAQISGVRYVGYDNVNMNGCTTVVNTYGVYNNTKGSFVIPDTIKNQTEPVYIATICCAYNGTTNSISFNNLTVS